MRQSWIRLACVTALACGAAGADRPPSFKEEMRFGVEAAQRGLWREAIFRWEKHLGGQPGNAHLHNNLGVAYEQTGRLDLALREYSEARRLDPDSREIRDNHESFLALCRTIKSCGDLSAAPGEAATAGTAPGEAAPAASPSPAPQPQPSAEQP